jgi:hypothetical protein
LGKRNLEKKFSDILLESIDEALLTLGEKAKSSIYFYLETKFAIPKKEIPNRISDFSDALEQIFGLGARQIEILIMRCLNERVNCTYEWVGPKWLVPDLTFKKYVALTELTYNDSEKTENMEIIVDGGEMPRKEINE